MAEGGGPLDKLARLRESYARRLPERLDELDQTLADESTGATQTLRDLVHKLKGSAATFGFAELSAMAARLETAADGALASGDRLPKERAWALVADMRHALTAANGAALSPTAHEIPNGGASANEHHAALRSVLLLDPTPEDVEILTRDLTPYGYHVQPVADGAAPLKIMAERCSAIIMAINPDSTPSTQNAVAELRRAGKLAAPVLCLCDRDDMTARLAAARSGASAFFARPVSSARLVDRLDALTMPEGEEPFQVLVVDDDPSMASYVQAILEGDGMIVEVVTDPMIVLDTLDSFSPELILMDLCMPNCDGMEVAAVIRQQESLAGVPIVFLSGESDVEKHMGAMEQGGDDFLTKPFRSAHLIAAVNTRARRFRQLRSLMVRDSLTGLFNHTSTMQILEKEMALARRERTPMTLATLDIDHFKSVNDTHGHGAGDRVIKSLARLLKQRLRASDVIGRMGGEEFAVVLPGTTATEADVTMNALRQSFSEMRHATPEAVFSATFSCGLAAMMDTSTPASLFEVADSALYAAKHRGRNRIVIGMAPGNTLATNGF